MATTSPSHIDKTRDSSAPSEALQRGPGRLLTIPEVAEWLGVSKGWVYDHVTRKQPRLPCIRFGELTRFRQADIERFIEEHGWGRNGS
jgi:excisionase family DNA binding protein